MKAQEILDFAANGQFDHLHKNGVYHAFIGVHSINIHHWKRGLIYSPMYEEILADDAEYSSVTLLSPTEDGCVKQHVVSVHDVR